MGRVKNAESLVNRLVAPLYQAMIPLRKEKAPVAFASFVAGSEPRKKWIICKMKNTSVLPKNAMMVPD